MQTTYGHLTYCSNIHPGETWDDHFAQLQKNIPLVRKTISPSRSFGIGLRLSNIASEQLLEGNALASFKNWLKENDCYVFIMNGFPYGGFHRTRVKDQVHAPDWTTKERVEYTKRLIKILSELLPDGMSGGISTSPLSYKYWYNNEKDASDAIAIATGNILEIANVLADLRRNTNKSLHIDIEPEPDGSLGNGPDFFNWYLEELVPMAHVQGFPVDTLKEHIQLCYDVCHFAVGYEDHAEVIERLKREEIRVGRIQISAALKAKMSADPIEKAPVINAFRQFNEDTYLHQVVAKTEDGKYLNFPDLPDALNNAENPLVKEWRSHFHVPLFIDDYGVLQSTQDDIRQVLSIQKNKRFTNHLEIETYTWEVLPPAMKLPIAESITREFQWVLDFLTAKQ